MCITQPSQSLDGNETRKQNKQRRVGKVELKGHQAIRPTSSPIVAATVAIGKKIRYHLCSHHNQNCRQANHDARFPDKDFIIR